MHRVVFDTVVLVRALINPAGLWGRLVFSYFDRYRLVVSPSLVKEYMDVLHRPEITRRFRSTEGIDVRRAIEMIVRAEMFEPEKVPAVSRDAKDDKVLAVAQAANADFLVSEDQDLLTLVEYEGTRIVDARTFLALLPDRSDA